VRDLVDDALPLGFVVDRARQPRVIAADAMSVERKDIYVYVDGSDPIAAEHLFHGDENACLEHLAQALLLESPRRQRPDAIDVFRRAHRGAGWAHVETQDRCADEDKLIRMVAKRFDDGGAHQGRITHLRDGPAVLRRSPK